MESGVGTRLEQYTLRYPQEVLLVTLTVAGETDQVLIFRGFSSSLVRPTAFDPEVPVMPEAGEILSIDRLQGPYDPQHPSYLERDLSWETMASRLEQAGL